MEITNSKDYLNKDVIINIENYDDYTTNNLENNVINNATNISQDDIDTSQDNIVNNLENETQNNNSEEVQNDNTRALLTITADANSSNKEAQGEDTEKIYGITDEAKNAIAHLSSGDLRSAINLLEVAYYSSKDQKVTLEQVSEISEDLPS